MQNQQEYYRKQALRYCYDDGFMEIALGLLFTLASVALTGVIALDKPAALIAAIVVGSVLLGLEFASVRVVNNLKERITYLRTGFVQPRKEDENLALTIGATAAFLLLTLVVVLLVQDAEYMITLANGMIMAWALGYLGYRAALPRLYAVAALALASGIVSPWLPLPEGVSYYMLPYGVAGLALLVTGTITLLIYLRANPAEE